jgi:putative spermidine/putrescine transport system ATP-binding protein
MSVAVSLEEVSCLFSTGGREVIAVDRVSLDIHEGEFFTLLGPSGSGKTTCLRMIGGFTLPSSGQIRIQGVDVSQSPPNARPVNTVFQDYALFPHMTVLENVAYALMVQGIDKSTREKKAQSLLDMVLLPEVGNRKPGQLSGGQRQRVALARALISQPKVLLLDEPLGALDLKLREQMQTELKLLQRKLGITFIFVTHDQHEALSMSDRIGIFNKGRIEQVATPTALYAHPKTRFVAEFVGAANVFHGDSAKALGFDTGVMIRPERISLSHNDSTANEARVLSKQYFGSFWRVQVELHGLQDDKKIPLIVDLLHSPGVAIPDVGDTVQVYWGSDAVHRIDDRLAA